MHANAQQNRQCVPWCGDVPLVQQDASPCRVGGAQMTTAEHLFFFLHQSRKLGGISQAEM